MAKSILRVANTAIAIPSLAKFYLDGTGLTGDTYLVESSANVLDLYAGGAKTLSLTGTGAAVVGTLSATTTSGYGLTVTTATNAFSGINIARTVNTPSTWDIYTPAGQTDLRFFNSADRVIISSAGLAVTGTLSATGAISTSSGNITLTGTNAIVSANGTTGWSGYDVTKTNGSALLGVDDGVTFGYADGTAVIRYAAGKSLAIFQTGGYPSTFSSTGLAVTGTLSATSNGSVLSGTNFYVSSVNAASLGSPGMFLGYNSSTLAGTISAAAVGAAPTQGLEIWAYNNVSAFSKVATFSAVAASAGLAVTGTLSATGGDNVDYNGLTIKSGVADGNKKAVLWTDSGGTTLGRQYLTYSTGSTAASFVWGSLYNGGANATDLMTLSPTGLAVTGTLSATGTFSGVRGEMSGSIRNTVAIPQFNTETPAFTYGYVGNSTDYAGIWVWNNFNNNNVTELRIKTSDAVGAVATVAAFSSTGLAVTGTLSATGKAGIGGNSSSSDQDSWLDFAAWGALGILGGNAVTSYVGNAYPSGGAWKSKFGTFGSTRIDHDPGAGAIRVGFAPVVAANASAPFTDMATFSSTGLAVTGTLSASGASSSTGAYSFGSASNYGRRLLATTFPTIYENNTEGAYYLGVGAKHFGGGTWTPDSTSAAMLIAEGTGWSWYTNTGLTGGVNFSNTLRMTLSSTGLAVTGTLSATSEVISTGVKAGHGANRAVLSREGSSLSMLSAYGVDASTNGYFVVRSLRSDGSNVVDVGSFTSTGLAVTGTLAATNTQGNNHLTLTNSTDGLITQIENNSSGQTLYTNRNQPWKCYVNNALVTSTSSTGLAVTGTLSASGITSVTDVTDATSTTAASLKTAGGLGVAKSLYVGGIVRHTSVQTGLTAATISNVVDIDGTFTADASQFNAGSYTVRARGSVTQTNSSQGTQAIGLNAFSSNTASLVRMSGARIDVRNLSTGTVSNGSGVWVVDSANSGGGTFTTFSAFECAALTGATFNFAFRSTGAGIVSIGDTTDASSLSIASTVLQGGLAVAKKMFLGDNLILPKASGKGIKTEGDTYMWRDLIGDITPKTIGAGTPTLDTITGNIRGFRYTTGDDCDAVFHIPHDYVPGTHLYIHPHWTHNGTNISGSLVVTIYATYAKGHQQANFASQITATITDGSLNITNTPALMHRIPEIQLSTTGGSASSLNTSDIEVDGIILLHFDVTTIPTITGGSGEPFLLTFDIHYQSSNIGTKNKINDFYT